MLELEEIRVGSVWVAGDESGEKVIVKGIDKENLDVRIQSLKTGDEMTRDYWGFQCAFDSKADLVASGRPA